MLANETVSNLLSCDERRNFWLRYDVGDVTFGRDRFDRNVVLRYEDENKKVNKSATEIIY